MDWKEARNATGMSHDDVVHHWKNREMPKSIKNEFSRSKLQRLEANGSYRLSCVAKAHLADLLGQRLSDIDEEAAEDYRALTAQDALISTCNTASPAIAA